MNLHPGAGWSDFFLKVYRIAVIVLISISLWGPLTTALPQLLGYSIF